MPDLRIDNTTTLDQLRQFMSQLGPNDKIRGVEDDNGVTLYSNPRDGNLVSKLFDPGRQERRELGEQGIKTVLRNTFELSEAQLDRLVGNIMHDNVPRTNHDRQLRTPGLDRILQNTQEQLDRQVTFGGRDYTQIRQIGKDGNGLVHIYQCGDDSIVVKQPKGDDQQTLLEQTNDRDVQERIRQRGGHPNVLPMLGSIEVEGGAPMIVMPLAPNGDARKLTDKMYVQMREDPPQVDDTVSRDIAYTMLKDVGESIRFLHDECELLHLDLKLENYLIDSNGNLMLSDFGTSKVGLNHDLRKYPVDDQRSCPPEVCKSLSRKDKGDPEIEKQLEVLRETIRNTPEGEEKAKLREQRNALAKELEESTKNMAIPVNPQTDSWVLGLVAYRLLVDPRPTEDYGNPFVLGLDNDKIPISNRIEAFGEQKEPILDKVLEWCEPNDPIRERIKDLTEDERTLVNGLLHPDPAQRMSVKEALVFIDSHEITTGDVRERIVQIARSEIDVD